LLTEIIDSYEKLREICLEAGRSWLSKEYHGGAILGPFTASQAVAQRLVPVFLCVQDENPRRPAVPECGAEMATF
jgi:hypothetical protein